MVLSRLERRIEGGAVAGGTTAVAQEQVVTPGPTRPIKLPLPKPRTACLEA